MAYSELSNDPPLDGEGCEPPAELDGWTEALLCVGLAGADASVVAGCTGTAVGVVAVGASVWEARSASGCAGVAALDARAAEAACAEALAPDGWVAIALGTLPAIGEPPRSSPGIAALLEKAPSDEDASCREAPPEPSRPIAKKQPNTSAAVTSSVGHWPFMLAP
jgi:hypothetical protein